MIKNRAIKGFKDILPEAIPLWHHIESTARDHFESYGFGELRSPVLEFTDLFARSIGEATDIVEKEMYTFKDRDGKMITLRPEGTAGVIRSYIEQNIHRREAVSRLYYMGPMFRHERPQAGRLRQFYQIGAEVIGSGGPLVDVEVIHMLYSLFEKLEVPSCILEINNLGCPVCRAEYIVKLKTNLNQYIEELCESCKKRFNHNPLRILDCKRESCRAISAESPKTIDHLCSNCADHHEKTIAGLDILKLPYKINPHIVRGLDYYTRTTFEITSNMLGAQSAVAAGGRYDGLVEQLGGPKLAGVGFAIGIERVTMLLQEKQITPAAPLLYIAALGERARGVTLPTAFRLKNKGIKTMLEYEDKSLRAMMKKANQHHVTWTLIIGEEEISNGKAVLRNMETKLQQELPISSLYESIYPIISNNC